MANYYVNRRQEPNDDHEVHRFDCARLPDPGNRVYLGDFTNCYAAVRKAKEHYDQSNGCDYCSRHCHTS